MTVRRSKNAATPWMGFLPTISLLGSLEHDLIGAM
jgi:hypothetical protein